MADSVVERDERKTSSPSADRPYRRIALRALMVAGFAGGAWLLSGSAAHAAAPHDTGTPGSTGPVVNLITGLGGNGLSGNGLGRNGLSSLPRLGRSRPVASAVDPIVGPMDSPVVGSIVASTGLGPPAETPGGAVSGIPAGLLGLGDGATGDPPTRLLSPVTGAVRGSVVGTADGSVGGGVGRPTRHPGGRRDTSAAATGRHAAAGVHIVDTAVDSSAGIPAGSSGSVDGTAATHPAGGPTVQRGTGDRHPHRPHARHDHRAFRGVHRADRVGSRHGPVPPQRAPLSAYPDPGLLPGGAPTGGSASQHQGSGFVVAAPVTVADCSVAGRRTVPAGEVEVSRLLAEAPTVSPD